MFFKTQEVWKLVYHSNFQKKENHALYLIMSSSNKKPVYCALKKVIFEG